MNVLFFKFSIIMQQKKSRQTRWNVKKITMLVFFETHQFKFGFRFLCPPCIAYLPTYTIRKRYIAYLNFSGIPVHDI